MIAKVGKKANDLEAFFFQEVGGEGAIDSTTKGYGNSFQ